MPTYEYLCTNGHAFERVQKMNDKPIAKCPECGAKAVRKISGGQGLIFKGSGFYITDYGKDGKGPRKSGEGAPSVSESSSSTSEGKPEAKHEGKSDRKGERKGEGAPKADAAPKPEPKPKSGSADPS